jgi:8-oxo-dGTP pyrophosphatase MutT (NUDIX family)
MAARKEISAGGVVYRRREDGTLEIQLITDRYGKTSLAKGKMEPGETVEQTALREILEETGITGRITDKVDIIAYTYQHAEYGEVDKEVHYYLVEAVDGTLKAQEEEIKGVEWYEPQAAWRRQREGGYNNNDAILRKGLALLNISVQ